MILYFYIVKLNIYVRDLISYVEISHTLHSIKNKFAYFNI